MKAFKKLWLAALLTAATQVAMATPVVDFNPAGGATGNNNDNQSVGWQFNVLSQTTVTGLGWFDEGLDGLSTDHEIGLWAPDGTLLVSALILSGTANALDGLFRTVGISPLVLAIGDGYIIGGVNTAGTTDRLAFDVSPTVNSSIHFVDATFGGIGIGFERPTNPSAAVDGFFGPSFSVQDTRAVSEPGSFALFTLAGVAGLGLRRKRRAA